MLSSELSQKYSQRAYYTSQGSGKSSQPLQAVTASPSRSADRSVHGLTDEDRSFREAFLEAVENDAAAKVLSSELSQKYNQGARYTFQGSSNSSPPLQAAPAGPPPSADRSVQ